MFASLNWLQKRLRSSSGRNPRPGADRPAVPLALLVLEDRVTPATLHWIGGAGGNGNLWSVAANWAENQAPTAGAALVFDTTTAGFSATANGFAPQNDLAGLTNVSVAINDASSAGDFAITGNPFGLSTGAGPALASTVTVGTGAAVANNLTLGANTTANVGFGSLTLGGIIGGGFSLTAAGSPSGNLTLNGANTFTGGTTVASGTVYVGTNSSLGTGTLTLNGGTLANAASFLHLPNAFVVNAPSIIGGGSFLDLDGNGTLNATLILANNGFLGLNGALSGAGGLSDNVGSTTLRGASANTFTGGTSIGGGTLVLAKTAGVDALASAVTLSESGTLELAANNQLNDNVTVALGKGSRLKMDGTSETLLSLTGFGTVDTGSVLTVTGGGNQLLTGPVTGAGSFTYAGSGSYTLGGASSSYTGTLTAQTGSLIVAADFSGATATATGGTLGGTGVVKTVTATSGVVNPATAGTAGTLNTAASGTNSLNGATFRADLGATGPNDHLALGANATLNLSGATLSVNALGATLADRYQIITSPTGGLSGAFSGMPDGTTFTVAGRTVQINYTSTAVTLTVQGVSSSTLHWTGAVSSAWGTAGNWAENRTPAGGDTLVFDTSAPGFAGTAAAFAPVNSVSGLTNLSLVINDASSAGDFNITGTGIGLATTAGTALASTVTVGSGATLATPLTLGSNTTAAVGLGTLTLSGVIGGGFSLTANGSPSGTLALNGANTFTGGTTVTSGTVSVSNNSALGTGTLTLNGGTLANSLSADLPNPFVVSAPSTVGGTAFFTLSGNGTLNADLRLTNDGFLSLNGALSGTGGLIADGFPGGTTLGGTAANTFTGPTSVIFGSIGLNKPAGVTALASPTVAIYGAFSSLNWGADGQVNGNTSVNLVFGGKLNLGGFSDRIAGLNGTGTINTGGTATAGLTVTGSGANLTTAAVTGSGLLTYSGTGSLTLGGDSSSYTGTLTAASGALAVAADFSGASGLALPGGTLGGPGLLGTLKAGGTGTVNPGGVGAGGLLSTKGSGALSSTLAGETFRVDLNDLGSSDQLVVGNGAALSLVGAVLDVNVLHSTTGKAYTIVSSATGGITGTFSGLANGATFAAGGRVFQINYTTNAVTLTDSPLILLTPTSLPTAGVGVPYNQTITPAGGTGAVTLTVSGATSPPGLSITGSGTNTITVSGTPTSSGTVTFTVTPSDGNGPQTPVTYSFVVRPPITLTPSATLPGGEVGFAYNQAITSAGGTGPITLTVSGMTNPTGLSITGSGTNTVTVSGTPTRAGTVTFTVTPSDVNGPQTAVTYSFDVTPRLGLTPTSLPTAGVGVSYNQTITPTGGSGAVTLAVSGVTNPTGLSITGSGTGTVTVSGTPTATGTVTFTVTPSDTFGAGTAKVYSFTVSPAIALSLATLPGGEVGFAYNRTIAPAGGTGSVTLTVTNVTNTTGLTITGSGTNAVTVSGTPTSAGTVTFTVTPGDVNGPQTAVTYSFVVTPPITLTPSALPTGEVGFAYNQTIAPAAGSGPVTLAVTNVTNATGLSITGTGGTVTVSGTPTGAGTVTFTVTVTDANGSQAPVTYSFVVRPPAAPPSAAPGTTSPPPPAVYSGAFVAGNSLVLQGSGVPGGAEAIPLPPGSSAFFTDVNGDGKGDVVVFLPNAVLVIDGNTGKLLFLIADTNGDGRREVFVF